MIHAIHHDVNMFHFLLFFLPASALDPSHSEAISFVCRFVGRDRQREKYFTTIATSINQSWLRIKISLHDFLLLIICSQSKMVANSSSCVGVCANLKFAGRFTLGKSYEKPARFLHCFIQSYHHLKRDFCIKHN